MYIFFIKSPSEKSLVYFFVIFHVLDFTVVAAVAIISMLLAERNFYFVYLVACICLHSRRTANHTTHMKNSNFFLLTMMTDEILENSFKRVAKLNAVVAHYFLAFFSERIYYFPFFIPAFYEI